MRSWTTAAAFLMMTFGALPATAADGQVWKNPTCGCCKNWVSHMAANGYALDVSEVDQATLQSVKEKAGMPAKYAGCHTAKIGGYAIEGHVPAAAITKLLAEKPDATGLAVPGMPAGSPGMETDGPGEAYDVLLIKKDGSSEIFEHVVP